VLKKNESSIQYEEPFADDSVTVYAIGNMEGSVSSCRSTLLFRAAVLIAALAPVAAQAQFGDQEATPPIRVIMRNNGTPSSATPTGTTPAQMLVAYGFSSIPNKGAGQTIGIVDAFDDPDIEADLGVFSAQFGLPACTTGNKCFTKLFAGGRQPIGNTGWGTEMSLDVEWAHAIAPDAKIVLVEATSASNANLFAAVDVAVANGANVVTMSFGGGESAGETQYDSHFTVPGVVFFASAGDGGNGAEYPAASPYVVGVGGTTLSIQSSGAYIGETAWSCNRPLGCAILGGTGGGQSTVEIEPSYQDGVQTSSFRTVPDVAYDADPATGVPVYDTYGGGAWLQVGGTSMASPQWAALMAIVNSSRVAADKNVMNTSSANNVFTALYSLTASLHDITSGKNGDCGAQCTAGVGYDDVTGLGSPVANTLIPALVALP
jgi:subtilase family serine protease